MALRNPIHSLTPDFFLNMVKSGAHRVISKEFHLNQLNVFPVTDRDTGSNMAALMRFFLAQSYSLLNLTNLIKQIADASLYGACGNSGMIFSSFFVGFSSKKSQQINDVFTTKEFVDCLRSGVEHAYQAVAQPIEGTMLSVMSSWVEACEKRINESNDFIFLFEKSLPMVNDALIKTEYQLEILKRNGVVDAGAMGFVEFISGMYDYIITQKMTEYENYNTIINQVDSHHSDEEPNYHYCAETLLLFNDQSTDELKQELEKLGDCFVMNRNNQYIKIHLHTNDVLALTAILKKHGTIQHQKIDPMKSQWQVSHKRKHSIALVTDSSADMPLNWSEQEQIHVLPLNIRLGEHVLLDRLSLNCDNLYKEIHENNIPANTAGPTPESVTRYLGFLTQHYDSIIVITLSSQISSTYQTVSNLAAKINNKKITVIDSRHTTAVQGLLVMMAAKWIAEGCAHEQMVEKIKLAITETHLFVTLGEFKTLTKLGRAPKVLGLLASWSRFKPIISMNALGKPSIIGLAIGQQMCWKKIAKMIKKIKSSKGINLVGIVHTSSLALAEEFSKFIEDQVKVKVDFITEASCVIGLHVGKGSVGIAISTGLSNM